MKQFFFILLFFLSIQNTEASELDLTLPIYHLRIDSAYLAQLYQNPWSDEYFPAMFMYDNIRYDCEVRFRGGSGRNLPKKSWAVKFEDNDNIFHSEKINLNAEYRDRSLMRNHLAMKLFQYLGYPVPDTEYLNLFVNDEYKGVYLQVEEVNEDFLKRNNRQSNVLYEAKSHAASMAPITIYDNYFINWDKKIGPALDYADIQFLFSKFYYWTKDDFETNVGTEIDLDNVLNYFALEFSIVGEDCFTKNLFLFFNQDKNQWEIFPWDNDGTFGNDIRGNYHASYAQFYLNSPLDYQVLFQRLMEYDHWRNIFWEKMSQIIHDGFDYLIQEIDSTYHQIKNDVYQDPHKLGSNSGFDSAVQQIKSFLAGRTTFLEGFRGFERISLSEFYCSNPFPSVTNPDVIFRARSASPQPVSIQYIKNFPFDVWAGRYTIETLQLFDDGIHDDLEASDLIYGNRLTFAANDSGLIPCCFKGSDFCTPANGLFYIECYRTSTLALNVNGNVDNFPHQLCFGRIFKNNDDYFVELINNGSTTVDLSYCLFQAGEYFHNFLLSEYTNLAGNDTLILSTNNILANYHFPTNESVGNFFYDLNFGDTLKLLSPTLSDLLINVCDSFSILQVNPVSIVINEINYHAVDSLDSDDWLEFYNPHDFSVDLSGWYFKDEDDNHIFVFPDNTVVNPNGFLVLCRSKSKFHQIFSDATNYVGDFDFGLRGGGELIRLYDIAGNLIDSLRYDDDPPWPVKPDGHGATLELVDPESDNSIAQNWAASLNHGTPGKRNSVFTTISIKHCQPNQFRLYQNYPNPFNRNTTIMFELAEPGVVELKIYNLTGQLVKMLTPNMGEHQIICDMANFSSGIYFYRLEINGEKSEVRKAILLK